MQTDNRLLEDLARVAQGAAGAFAGLREEIESRIKDQVDRVLSRMNLVRREEFSAVQAMAAKARKGQEELAARLGALEAKLGRGAKPGLVKARGNAKRRPKSR